ncbi:MAG: LCP family protein [Lachnospiraceae bacterium]|nr:LCP family protein [Lachnospiraceae bacterium]
MEQNSAGDDIIEIMPDVEPEEDHDIKISGAENAAPAQNDQTIENPAVAVAENEAGAPATAVAENEAGAPATEAELGAEISSIIDGPEAESIVVAAENEVESAVTESEQGTEISSVTAELDGGSTEKTAGSENEASETEQNIETEASETEQDIETIASEIDRNVENVIGTEQDTEITAAESETVTDTNETATDPDTTADTGNNFQTKIFGKSDLEHDDFAEEFDEIEHEQQDYEIMEEIGNSIINQVDREIRADDAVETETSEDEGSGAGGGDDPDNPDNEDKDRNPVLAFFAKIPKWGYAVIGSALVLTCFLLWMTMSAAGQSILVKLGSKWIAGKFTYQPVTQVDEIEYLPEEDLESGRDTADVTGVPEVPDNFEVVTPDITEEPTPIPEEKNVYNVLLIGEENIDSGSSRGRSDLIMIASVNKEQGIVRLVSILRDTLVAIPDHSDNRINAAYTIGGVSLLYETLKVNLGIEFDNYCLVNFDSFENIVDAIGGIDVNVTAEEADYLNRTNYISKPEFRTVTVGMNHFNGNQALGYCRIRKVPTADMLYSDIGRTSRQRRLMRQIFENFNKMNNVEMMGFVNSCIPYLTTDLTSEQLEQYILMLTSMNRVGYEEMRLPVEGSYHDAKIRGMLVTQIDLEVNSKALHSFIYGD